MTQVVCVSHTAGAHGGDVAKLVAERLGFRLVDEAIVAAAAAREQVSTAVMADAERRKSLVSRLVRELGRSGGVVAVELSPLASQETRDERLREVIRDVVDETAAAGRVVIVAHAASIGLGGRSDVLRVLVTASLRTRVERLGGDERAVKAEDSARADYIRRFYDVDRELPTHYDLVVNTDAVDPWRAADLIVAAAGS